MYLLVETTPKVGHSTNCIVLQHSFIHGYLSVFVNNLCTLICSLHASGQTDLPLSLPRTDKCTDLILIVKTYVAASDVLGTVEESIVSMPSLTVSVLAVVQRNTDTIYYVPLAVEFCKYFICSYIYTLTDLYSRLSDNGRLHIV